MKYALYCLLLGVAACQPAMNDMMGDGPADGGRADMPVDRPDDGMPDDGMPEDAEVIDMAVADAEVDAEPGALRINHLQMRATVNSYHDVDRGIDPELMGYVHLPLDEQAAGQGIRVFDFDLVPDRFAGIDLHPAVTDHPADDENHCGDLLRCLYQLDDWMDLHPDHPLVVVLVGEAYLFGTSHGLHEQLDVLELSMTIALDRERLLTPADVRGRQPDLRTAIRRHGWPTIDRTRGKAMFVLNDRGLPRTAYLAEGGQDPDDRLLFQIGDPALADDPATPDEVIFTFEPVLEEETDPWYFETDPADLERIEELAASGYLVHAISDDPEMIARLRAAGTHFVGTRFPDRLGPIPAQGPTACNPVTAPADCDPADIEPPR